MKSPVSFANSTYFHTSTILQIEQEHLQCVVPKAQGILFYFFPPPIINSFLTHQSLKQQAFHHKSLLSQVIDAHPLLHWGLPDMHQCMPLIYDGETTVLTGNKNVQEY